MSSLSMFFIIALTIFILEVIVIHIIESKSENKILPAIINFAAVSSFLICIVLSIITDHVAKDYLTSVGKVINNREIIEIQANDRLLQDNVTITYKDSNSNPVIYSTTLPWYCDIMVIQSEKTFIEIDSSYNTFCVYTDVRRNSDDMYTSKK